MLMSWMDVMSCCCCCVNDRWQMQEFDKQLQLASETACRSQQLADYEDRLNVCPSQLPSSTLLSGHQNVTAAGFFPHQQPSCNVWNGGFESAWKNHASGVVLPWQTERIMPSTKPLCEPVLLPDQQCLMKHINVRMATFVICIASMMQ